MSEERSLTLWVIFYSPVDYPGRFVVRRQWIANGDFDFVAFVFGTLAEAHQVLPPGLINIGRREGDVPSIVEVWI